eukprot:366032-Chlamydomonas_euryale.AAC.2
MSRLRVQTSRMTASSGSFGDVTSGLQGFWIARLHAYIPQASHPTPWATHTADPRGPQGPRAVDVLAASVLGADAQLVSVGCEAFEWRLPKIALLHGGCARLHVVHLHQGRPTMHRCMRACRAGAPRPTLSSRATTVGTPTPGVLGTSASQSQ